VITLDFKAELRDPDLARIIARQHRGCSVVTLHQHDQFFRLPEARLLRRTSPGEPVEWIHWVREHRARPTMSHFQIYDETTALQRWGTLMRPWVATEKVREIIMMDQTTIRLDQVTGLGWFMEISVLVTAKHNLAKCYETVALMRRLFSMALGEAVAGSYADLLVLARDVSGAGEFV
jgi:hypothetical protein